METTSELRQRTNCRESNVWLPSRFKLRHNKDENLDMRLGVVYCTRSCDPCVLPCGSHIAGCFPDCNLKQHSKVSKVWGSQSMSQRNTDSTESRTWMCEERLPGGSKSPGSLSKAYWFAKTPYSRQILLFSDRYARVTVKPFSQGQHYVAKC